jgi:RHS repeat-associated protein
MGTVRYTVVDGEVLSELRGGVKRDYVPDPLGSTVALLDATQTKTDTFQYWPYGESAGRTGTTATPFQYVGSFGYYQDGAARNYVRARYLDKSKVRWVTEDPIGFDGGSTNLYMYVYNQPNNFTDPEGLLVCCHVSCNIEGGNDPGCTGHIFGWGCGNNRTEAFNSAQGGNQPYSANSRMCVWNAIHGKCCQKRHCHIVSCQNKKYRQQIRKPVPNPVPVDPEIDELAKCTNGQLVWRSIITATGIVILIRICIPRPGSLNNCPIGQSEIVRA